MVNLLFLYICDVINLGHIPLFITTIISGRFLAALLGILFFNYLNINWKHHLSIVGGINVVIFIIIFFYMDSSPKAALRNNNYSNFVKHLLNIAKKNKKKLIKEDFDFLVQFMDYNERVKYDELFNSFSSKDINSIKTNDENPLDDNDEYNDLFAKDIPKTPLERKSTLKDEYLMSDDNNKVGSIKTLFNETKMKDYSFFDFFKFKAHFINFAILTFFWCVYNLIKSGMESTMNEIPEYYNHVGWPIVINIFGLINLFIIMLLYTSIQSSFHKILISIQLLTFICLLLGLDLYDVETNRNAYVTSIVVAKLIWNCLYLLLILMSLLIYPIMLRSKGLGWNISIGIFGKMAATFVIDLNDKHDYVLYFLVFDFFMLLFSYALPRRIGSIVIDLSKDENAKKFLDKMLKEDYGDKKNKNSERISLMSIIT